jgi:hypothetical protein
LGSTSSISGSRWGEKLKEQYENIEQDKRKQGQPKTTKQNTEMERNRQKEREREREREYTTLRNGEKIKPHGRKPSHLHPFAEKCMNLETTFSRSGSRQGKNKTKISSMKTSSKRIASRPPKNNQAKHRDGEK